MKCLQSYSFGLLGYYSIYYNNDYYYYGAAVF